jgi:lysophospholipase L1-like esterase
MRHLKAQQAFRNLKKTFKHLYKTCKVTKYNGRSAPTLVLVSPITHENLGGHFPDPAEHNKNLELYTKAMQKTANAKSLYFIDLFTPSIARTKLKNQPAITINGIHLNDAGYRLAAEWMGHSLGFGKIADLNSENG